MPFFQAPVTPNPTGINLKGITAIVTGATMGLGYETARQLLALHVGILILAVRNIPKGETAKKNLLADSGVVAHNPNATVELMQLDMDDYSSVKEFAAKVEREVPVLHLLVLNAGVVLLKFERSPNGHERGTQINYLSNVLLSCELLPLLNLANKGPVQPGSSILEHFDNEDKFLGLPRYSDTKLLCTMFVYELAKRVSSDEVIVNIMCPGMVNTTLSDVLPIYLRIPMNLYKKARARSIEEGGWLIVNSAAVAGRETHGHFLADKSISPPSDFIRSPAGQEIQRQLWTETLKEMVKNTTLPPELTASG